MADLSIVEKIKLFFNTAISTPFFIGYAVIGILLVVFMIFDIRKKKKFSKIIYIVSGIFLISFFFIKYFNIILKVLDSFVEIIMKALYFPNLGIYIVMLIITNGTFIYNLISKKSSKASKITTGVINIIIDFIFIMIIGIISSEKIDITSEVKLYSDATILTLLQISMALFASQYLLLLLIMASHKFKRYDKKDNTLVIDNRINTFTKDKIKVFKVLNFGDKND
ncbi:MAG: hypothetical protein IJ094_06210 [Bacilli bacterium]|nr:hypothetical protein [Bacilli bacterium]